PRNATPRRTWPRTALLRPARSRSEVDRTRRLERRDSKRCLRRTRSKEISNEMSDTSSRQTPRRDTSSRHLVETPRRETPRRDSSAAADGIRYFAFGAPSSELALRGTFVPGRPASLKSRTKRQGGGRFAAPVGRPRRGVPRRGVKHLV